jgi:hypothetical protein
VKKFQIFESVSQFFWAHWIEILLSFFLWVVIAHVLVTSSNRQLPMEHCQNSLWITPRFDAMDSKAGLGLSCNSFRIRPLAHLHSPWDETELHPIIQCTNNSIQFQISNRDAQILSSSFRWAIYSCNRMTSFSWCAGAVCRKAGFISRQLRGACCYRPL